MKLKFQPYDVLYFGGMILTIIYCLIAVLTLFKFQNGNFISVITEFFVLTLVIAFFYSSFTLYKFWMHFRPDIKTTTRHHLP